MEVGCSTPQLKALMWCLRSALSALTTSMSMMSKRTSISPSGELTASQEAAAISGSPRLTDIRRAMTDSKNILPAARTIAVLRTREAGRSAWRGQRHRTHGEADEGRHGEALLGARHQHHPSDSMFLKQAVRERGIPFEVTARPAIEYGSESMEK